MKKLKIDGLTDAKESSIVVDNNQVIPVPGSCISWDQVIPANTDSNGNNANRMLSADFYSIICKIFGWDTPYNIKEVLSHLVFATNYLLHQKNYDGHNYKNLNTRTND